MKQVFENPKINICLFINDNIITTSGVESNYAQKVETAIGVSGKNLTKASFNNLNFTL